MKTKEFKKRVEKLGFELFSTGSYFEIDSAQGQIAYVSSKSLFVVDTDWNDFHELKDEKQEALFNLLGEYAKTPIEKRKEEKNYYVIVSGDIDKKYFNYDTSTKSWIVGSNWETGGFQTIFTQSELDDLKQRDDIPLDWDKVKLIEVEDSESN